MQYARITDGAVAELIEGTATPLADRFHPDIVAQMRVVPDNLPVVVGWRWDGEDFTPPPAPGPAPIPPITARQLRLWLLSKGQALSSVDDAIAALPLQQREPARVEWEYSTIYERAHPLIASIGTALGFQPSEMDAGFIEAAGL